MAAVVQVESGGDPFAMTMTQRDDRTTPAIARLRKRSPTNLLVRGILWTPALLKSDSMNVVKLGVSVNTIVDPCINVHAGSAILASDYGAALRPM